MCPGQIEIRANFIMTERDGTDLCVRRINCHGQGEWKKTGIIINNDLAKTLSTQTSKHDEVAPTYLGGSVGGLGSERRRKRNQLLQNQWSFGVVALGLYAGHFTFSNEVHWGNS